jgi:hypothetical protein
MVAKKVRYTCGCEAEGDLISTFCQIHGNPQETSTNKRDSKKPFLVKFSRTGETTVMAHDAEEAKAHVETLMDEEDDIENSVEGAHQCTTIISAEEVPEEPEED